MSISIDEVSFAAGNIVIVNGVSLTVAKGKVLGLLGPNGSGKSSLLRLICRLRRVRSGIIRLGEDDISSLPRAALARRVAFVEQQSTTDTQLTVREVVRLGRRASARPYCQIAGAGAERTATRRADQPSRYPASARHSLADLEARHHLHRRAARS
nr:ABC transporter ATP-binding protein [Rhizobium leguminosarum]